MTFAIKCGAVSVVTVVVLAGAAASADTITDDFTSYASQAQFEAVYAVDGYGTAQLDLAEDVVRFTATESQRGVQCHRLTEQWQFDSSHPLSLSFSIEEVTEDAGGQIFLGILNEYPADPNTAERIVMRIETYAPRDYLGLTMGRNGAPFWQTAIEGDLDFEGDDELDQHLLGAGTWTLELDALNWTVRRGATGQTWSAPHGLDVGAFANGAWVTTGLYLADLYAASGTSTIDSLSVIGTPVPEPTTVALLALGAAGMLRRRRG